MGITSTPFISYHDINVAGTELLEDAFGLNSEYCDVIEFLAQLKPVPGKQLMTRLFEHVSKQN